MLIPAFTILNNIALHFLTDPDLVSFYYFYPGIVLLFGPAILTHIRSQQGNKRVFIRAIPHLIPATLVMLISIYFLFVSEAKKEQLCLQIVKGEDPLANSLYTVILLHTIIYLIVAKRNLTTYRKAAESYFTSYKELNLQWINYFVNNLIWLNIFLIVVYFIQMTSFPSLGFYADMIVTPLCAFAFYLVMLFKSHTFHAIINKEQFLQLIRINEPIIEQPIPIEKVITPRQLEQYEQIKSKLEVLLNSEKIYLNPGLNLQQTADAIGCGRTALSQTINTQYRMTFFDLINSCRVKEAKQLLCDANHRHLKNESIGELAGFSSRASFFSIFKKHTSYSPAEFKEINSK